MNLYTFILTTISHLNLECIRVTLKRFVVAINSVGSSEELLCSPDNVTPQDIIAACTAIHSVVPNKDDPDFWKTVQNELLATLMDIQRAESSINKCEDISNIDLVVLEATATAKIHLGLVMALVLCPPLVDPLRISATECHYLNEIVSLSMFCVA